MALPPSVLPRRVVLAAGLAVVAGAVGATSGCSTPWGRLRIGRPDTGGSPGPDADTRALAAARTDARALHAATVTALASLTAAAPTNPTASGPGGAGAAGVLAALRDALAEQLEGLGDSVRTSPSPTSTATSPRAPSALPAELAAAARRARRALPFVDPGPARLLACLAAGDDVAATALAAELGVTAPPDDRSAESDASGGSSAPGGTGTRGSSSSTSAAPRTTSQRAVARLLAAHEASVYGYGVLAVRLSGTDADRARADLATHDRTVDGLRARLLADGVTPPPAAPAWALPAPVHDATSALALAHRLESACTSTAADLVLAAPTDQRAWAAAQVGAGARRAAAWRAAAGDSSLDGLPGLVAE